MFRSVPQRLISTHARFRASRVRPFTTSVRRFSPNVPPATPVEKIILDHVKAVGPMSYATYMQFCLAHPTEGYYMKSENKVFGAQGDFITSPDISQIFGELIATWLFSQWEVAGSPPRIRLLELGPGNGTLINDILRTIIALLRGRSKEPDVQVHLVETSQALRRVQSEKLSGAPIQLQWFESVDHVPHSNDAFTMIVAHEFFDALPIHVFRKTEEGWKEIMVSSKSAKDGEEEIYPRLQHVLSPEKTAISTVFGNSSSRFQSLPVGTDLEVSPTAFRLARKAAELLVKQDSPAGSSPGGCGLIIDYGRTKSYESSRRGFKNHEVVDIFHRPGECDLTANVDFAYLKESMQDLIAVYEPMTQNQFLSLMGMMYRLGELLKNAGEDKAKYERIMEGAKRLIDPEKMGNEYSVLGFSTNDEQPYPFSQPE